MERRAHLDDDDRLLDDVADARRDEVEQDVDAALCGLLDLDGALTDGPDRLAHEVDVDLGRVPARAGTRSSASSRRAGRTRARGRWTHSLSSLRNVSTFFSVTSLIMISSFSTLT